MYIFAPQSSVFPLAIASSLNRNNSTLSSFDKGIGPCFAGFQIRAKSSSISVRLCGPFRQAQKDSKRAFVASIGVEFFIYAWIEFVKLVICFFHLQE